MATPTPVPAPAIKDAGKITIIVSGSVSVASTDPRVKIEKS
jgi:hypothetical protein